MAFRPLEWKPAMLSGFNGTVPKMRCLRGVFLETQGRVRRAGAGSLESSCCCGTWTPMALCTICERHGC